MKVSIFGGFPVENPTNKATGLKALLEGISLSESGSEGFRVRLRRLAEYGSVACLVEISGPQKGPAERGHVKKHQKSSKSVKIFFDTFRHFSRRAKKVKNRQKVSKYFSTLFDNLRAAPVFRMYPLHTCSFQT